MKKRKQALDPAAVAQRKKKRTLIVLAVVLVPILAWSVPNTLKSLNAKPAAAPAPAPAPAPAASGTPAASGAPATPAAATPDAGLPAAHLPEPDRAPEPAEGQLVTFSVFKSKDPFVPQLGGARAASTQAEQSATPPANASQPVPSPEPPAATPKASVAGTTEPSASEPSSAPPATNPPAESQASKPATAPASPAEPPAQASPAEPVSPASPAEPAAPQPSAEVSAGTAPAAPPASEPAASDPAQPSSATLSVNDVVETVTVGGDFPKAEPLFRLMSLEEDVAEIGIAGGSLQDGAKTVPLKVGGTLTLMNTADGTRYVLKLVKIG